MNDIIETIEYKGHAIDIYVDSDPANPFTDWDGEPPVVVAMSGYGSRWDISEYGIDLSAPDISGVCDGKLATILDTLDIDLERALDGMYMADRMDALVDLYETVGIVAMCQQVNGYAQSHYGHVLSVITPEFLAKHFDGHTLPSLEDQERIAKNAIDLYETWMRGDVFGYQIESIDDSCWGFYGSDHETNGLFESARDAIDSYLDNQTKV